MMSIGWPSSSTLSGYPSASSAKIQAAVIERNPAAEFAPVATSIPDPSASSFVRIVFPESRSRAGWTLSRSRGVSRSIGARRCLLHRLASSTVGITTSDGPPTMSIKYPSHEFPVSVAATCAALRNTTR